MDASRLVSVLKIGFGYLITKFESGIWDFQVFEVEFQRFSLLLLLFFMMESVIASQTKNRRTTLERVEKFLSKEYFTDVNLHGKLYSSTAPLSSILHWDASQSHSTDSQVTPTQRKWHKVSLLIC